MLHGKVKRGDPSDLPAFRQKNLINRRMHKGIYVLIQQKVFQWAWNLALGLNFSPSCEPWQ